VAFCSFVVLCIVDMVDVLSLYHALTMDDIDAG